jgi:hypothetical protein
MKIKQTNYILYRDKCHRCRFNRPDQFIVLEHYQELHEENDYLLIDNNEFETYNLNRKKIVIDKNGDDNLMQALKKQYHIISSFEEKHGGEILYPKDIYKKLREYANAYL